MKKIVIIGASGLLGGHLIEEALAKGYSVTAVARKFPMRSAAHFYREKINIITSDAFDLDPELLGEQDLLINLAAHVGATANDLCSTNLNLLKQVVSVYRKARIKNFIHVSSVATMSKGQKNYTVSEKDHGHFRDTTYAESKFVCDQWLEEEFGQELLTIHPCYMLGKWDAKPSSGAILLALQLKKIKGFLEGTKNFVHAKDVAGGILSAHEQEVRGRFLLGGVNLSTSEFLRKCLRLLNLTDELIAYTKDEELDLLGREFFLSSSVDDSRARKEWGYTSQNEIDDIILETISYFREYRLLPRIKGHP